MKKRKISLFKNTVILSIGKLLPKIISILILPIITAKLTKTEFGTYDLITTLVSFVLPIATLQTPAAAFRFLLETRGKKKNSTSIISSIFFITISISIIACTILFLIWRDLDVEIRLLACIYLLLDNYYYFTSQVARGLSYNKQYAYSSIILSIIHCIGIYVFLKFNDCGLVGVLISLCAAYLASIIYLSIKTQITKYISLGSFNIKTSKKLIKYSWPMIPNNLSAWILNLSDRIIINYFLGIESVAIYSVANKIPNLLSIFQQVFNMSWQENASLTVNDKDADSYYSTMLSDIYRILIGCTAILIGLVPLLFKIIIRGDYDRAYMEMPLLILAMFYCCLSSFLGGIYVAHKKTKKLATSTFMVSICNIAIDLLLVKSIGITAGSISTLVSYMLLYYYRLKNIRKFQKINVNYKKQFVLIIIIVLMLAACFINNLYLNILNVIIGILFFTFINNKLIKNTIKYIKRNRNARN